MKTQKQLFEEIKEIADSNDLKFLLYDFMSVIQNNIKDMKDEDVKELLMQHGKNIEFQKIIKLLKTYIKKIDNCNSEISFLFEDKLKGDKIITTIPKEQWGVHASHCCRKHGCKYGDGDNCPVETGDVKQLYNCEFC